MKKILSFIIAIIMVFSTPISSQASLLEKSTNEFHVAKKGSDTSSVDLQAAEYLSTMKSQFANNSYVLGLSAEELKEASLGYAFTPYVFDKSGQILSDNDLAYPVIYDGEIIAILETGYDSVTSRYNFTFGKAYADELNKLRYTGHIDTSENLIIGTIEDKFFLTDGQQVDVILEAPIDGHNSTISDIELKKACENISESVEACYMPIDQTERIVFADPGSEQVSSLRSSMPNPLPVPHVQQTGVCGVAAWASVLNYRFNTSYTNASLASAMAGKYSSNPDGSPYMTDYRDYANDNHNAGCVFKTSLSFSNLTDAIGKGRPIMGSWKFGSDCHAVLIIGYVKNSASNYTYIVKNPWYEYKQSFTVTDSSSVIYYDKNYIWKLSQVVY